MPGPAFRTSLKVLVAGLVIAIPAAVMLVVAFARAIDGPTMSVPGTSTLELHDGTYDIYELAGHTSSVGPFSYTRTDFTTVGGGSVVVVAPDGASVPVRAVTRDETITRNRDIYVAAAEFEAPSDGTYTLTFDNVPEGEVMIAPPLVEQFKASAPWFFVAAIGGITTLTGMLMIAIGAFRRAGARGRAAQANAYANAYAYPSAEQTGTTDAAPAGWYPDPSGAFRLRYWDGGRWTEHTSN